MKKRDFLNKVLYSGIAFIISVLIFSCTNNSDLLLGASDELHYLKLYSENSRFEILHNAINTAQGSYSISSDTIYLDYDADEWIKTKGGDKKSADSVLTKVLFIDDSLKLVKSLDGKEFCAKIYLNKIE